MIITEENFLQHKDLMGKYRSLISVIESINTTFWTWSNHIACWKIDFCAVNTYIYSNDGRIQILSDETIDVF